MPGGTRWIDFLPFVGTVETGSVDYRKQLFEQSLVVIQHNPLFGDADYRQAPELLQLIQGEHIIDFVNTYLEIALSSGLVGLSLFLGIFASILARLRRLLKFHAVRDADFDTYVRASIATLIAILVTIATAANIDFIPYVYWSFAGLTVAIIRIGYRELAGVAPAGKASQVAA
jgi:O-antigen ligase